jgi:diphosphomevalonate decarboxylase
MPYNNPPVAIGRSNIALIKYWGVRDAEHNIPTNSSFSFTLDSLTCECTAHPSDRVEVVFNGARLAGRPLKRFEGFYRTASKFYPLQPFSARFEMNFPRSVGIAGSAAVFSSLAAELDSVFSLGLDGKELSRLARLGSGSASRSVHGGFVKWHAGGSHDTSYAEPFLPASHWRLVDVVAIVSDKPKRVGSASAHVLVLSSPMHDMRMRLVEGMLDGVERAVGNKDISTLSKHVEMDAMLIHAIAATASQPFSYLMPKTKELIGKVVDARASGIPVMFTLDAGPTVHMIAPKRYMGELEELWDNVRVAEISREGVEL